jgi:hypothetical protein
VLFEAEGNVTLGDPDSTYEATVPVRGLTFRKPGVYTIEAMAGGVPFARRELLVISRTPAAAPVAELSC